MKSRDDVTRTYEAYLISYVRASVFRPKEPGLFVGLFDLRRGRLERAVARALGVSDGLAENLRSKSSFREELERLLEE